MKSNRYEVRMRYAGSVLLTIYAENKVMAKENAQKMVQGMDSKTFMSALEPQYLDTEITQLNIIENELGDES